MRRKTEIILHKITGFPFYEFQPASIFRRFCFWLQESWNNDLKIIFVSSITKYLNKQHVTFYICWGSSSDNLFCEFYVLDAQTRLYPWSSSLSCWHTFSSIIWSAYFLKRANTERKITSESSWCKNTSPAPCNPTICFIGLLVLLI